MLPPVDFPTLGWQVIDWIERYLCHGKGDLAGQPIVIDDEMALFLCHAYRLDSNGRRCFDLVVLGRPKGRAKSEIAAAIACAELAGPVRFARWDRAGEPVGRPIQSPFIRCLATEESQTGNTYDSVRVMLDRGRIASEIGLDVGLTRTFLGNGLGEIRPSTAGSASKDGGLETFGVADETHLYKLPELRDMFETVQNNTTKRPMAEPWMLCTTTAFGPGEDSIAERHYDEFAPLTYEQCLQRRVLWDWREGPAVADWADDTELEAALRSVYGAAAEWADFKRIIAQIRRITRARAERLYLNRVVRTDAGWITPDEWRHPELVQLGSVPADDALITLGFDGSMFDDATALVGCEVETGLIWPLGVWEKPEGPSGDSWQVPVHEVDAVVVDAMKRWDVWRMYCDPPHWQDEIDRWRGDFGGEVVIDWWTNRDRAMAAAVERFETAVRARTMRHNGDRTLTIHVGHCRVRTTRAGRLIVKERPRSPKKIDAAVAAVLAYEARNDAIAAGALTKRRRRRRLSASRGGGPKFAGF